MGTKSPYFWLATLEAARRSGDDDLAERCVKELRKFGVDVEFAPKVKTKKAPVAEAVNG